MRALVLFATLSLASCVDGFNPEYYSADPFALGVVDGLSRAEGVLRDVEARTDISAERKLELLEERIAAEITEVNAAIDEGRPVEAEGER